VAHTEQIRAHAARASRNARTALAGAATRLDTHAGRARRAGVVATTRADQRLEREAGRLIGAARTRVRDAQARSVSAGRRLSLRSPRALAEAERVLGATESRIRALDPERALARGWSITRTADGRLVRTPADVGPGAALRTQTAGGEVRSTVDGDG